MPWEESSGQIRHRLVDPFKFKPGTFRTIYIQEKKPRILGIVGKPKDGGGMKLQALHFPKGDGWTMAKAKAWVEKHEETLKEAEMEFKIAIPVHHTEIVNEPWDAGANLKRLGDSPSKSTLRRMHAWVDADADPATKAAYKLPHHMVDADGNVGSANMKACASAMGRLNGGGLDIPDSERAGVHRHLAAHYKDAGMEAPMMKGDEGPIEYKDCTLELKQLDDQGLFEGYASIYGLKDLGNDIVETGAFDRTMAAHADGIPILWQHNTGEVIGLGRISSDEKGLKVNGKLELALYDAQQAYIRLKTKIVKGLSIGFRSMADEFKNGVRHLKEVKLFEISLVTIPMCEQALVTSVKSVDEKKDFASNLEARLTDAMRYQAIGALDSALSDTLWSRMLDDSGKLLQSSSDIDDFKQTYLSWLPKMLSLMAEYRAVNDIELKQIEEIKAGARLSADSQSAIKKAMAQMEKCMSMLEDHMDKEMSMEEGPMMSMMGYMQNANKILSALLTSEPAKGANTLSTSPRELATKQTDDPDEFHSLAEISKGVQSDLRGILKWN